MDLTSLKSLYGTEGDLEAGLQERYRAAMQLGLGLFSFSFCPPTENVIQGSLKASQTVFQKSSRLIDLDTFCQFALSQDYSACLGFRHRGHLGQRAELLGKIKVTMHALHSY